jgi:hypothetical protein
LDFVIQGKYASVFSEDSPRGTRGEVTFEDIRALSLKTHERNDVCGYRDIAATEDLEGRQESSLESIFWPAWLRVQFLLRLRKIDIFRNREIVREAVLVWMRELW